MNNIYVYGVGKFSELKNDFKKDKIIIKIHDIINIDFFEHTVPNGIALFFNDTVPIKKSIWEKILSVLGMSEYKDNFISEKQAKTLCEFILYNKNKNQDYIIHCTYGKSRSVAVASFIEDYFKYKIANKTSEEISRKNPYVYELLQSTIKKYHI